MLRLSSTLNNPSKPLMIYFEKRCCRVEILDTSTSKVIRYLDMELTCRNFKMHVSMHLPFMYKIIKLLLIKSIETFTHQKVHYSLRRRE
jgi:hypothetical protein